MKNLRVANRYARALLGLAEENGISERAYQDMNLIYESFQATNELTYLLKSPIVRVSKKLRIIHAVFQGKVHKLILHYLSIITRKNRSGLIEAISFEFMKLHRESKNVETVRLITAGEVDEHIEKKAFQIASQLTTKNIEFHRIIRPEIVGGFILQVGELQYDASVKRKLTRLKKHLITT